MVEFRCKRFPRGVAHVRTRLGVVDFVDGKATVDDPDLAAALREAPAAFQISEVGADAKAHGDLEASWDQVKDAAIETAQPITYTAPSERDNKPAWVDWAVHNGADRAEADAMTKKDLIAAFG